MYDIHAFFMLTGNLIHALCIFTSIAKIGTKASGTGWTLVTPGVTCENVRVDRVQDETVTN